MIKYIGKKVRNEKGFTVRGLAAEAGIAPSTISKWENGSAIPDFETLDLVAVAMDVNPWDLIMFRNHEKETNNKASVMLQIAERNLKKEENKLKFSCTRKGVTESERENIERNHAYAKYVYNLLSERI